MMRDVQADFVERLVDEATRRRPGGLGGHQGPARTRMRVVDPAGERARVVQHVVAVETRYGTSGYSSRGVVCG
jgi:hypothetical protein